MSIRCAGLLAALLIPVLSAAGQVSRPGTATEPDEAVLAEGYAGVYPDILRGRVTTSGAVYDPDRLIASHRYLPLGSVVRVIRDDTGESVSVTILDRGPYTGGRIMDLSEAAARELRMHGADERLVRVVRAAGSTQPGPGTRQSREARVAARFTIQLGSYSNEAAAETARGRVEGAWVQRVEVDGQVFFRLNFGRYETREDATEDLDGLEAQGFFGFVKSLAEAL
jgi:rare lipoprotein A